MLTNKNVLVNGCSFSRGPGSWPYALQNIANFNLVNLAQAGAGNTYIHHSTARELMHRTYDHVIIMWSGITRIDCQVEDIEQFKTPYTSEYQSTRNDWPEKKVYPINDQDYVEKNWVFGNGTMNGDPFLVKNKFLDTHYRYCGTNEFVNSFLMHVISLQALLKQLDIQYTFMYYNNYEDTIKNNVLYKLIDQSNVHNKENISSIMSRINSYDSDSIHPGLEAHSTLAQDLYNHLTK
jgi:hypothetical protein